MSRPFVDIDLENRVLRLLVFDSDVDKMNCTSEIVNNIEYVINLGVASNVFYSDFRKWVFSQIIENYVKFSDCLTKEMLLRFVKKKYPNKDDFENKKILSDKIFKNSFEKKAFRNLFDELKHKYNYRVLFDLNYKLTERLKEDYEKDNNDSLKIAQEILDANEKILAAESKIRIIEEDAFQNIDADIALLKDKRANPDKYKGITSGYRQIDQATGGWRPGELAVVLGRPGVGKSVLLLNFGIAAYDCQHNVAYVTIEMPLDQQKARFQSKITETVYSKLKIPEFMTEEEIERFEKLLREEKEKHKNYFWIIDAPEQCDSNFIGKRIQSFENISNKKIDLLIVDPLYLMKPNDRKDDDPVGAISWDLKLLARKLNIPILAASQFNREGGKRHQHGKRTNTMDAAFTDKLAFNSDIMIGMTSPDDYNIRLEFPKSRDFTMTEVFLVKKFDVMSFKIDDKVN